ncbi:hypothetical protein KGV31_002139 [Vibrio parahaemolyticus]|nr:hypothetical protein [Vibrio parahaemolyticus]EHU0344283.1 hypothetical protein [Vibrio parahaemolyticus]EHU0354317.1 hypothetical protein [Vibrio parahaemolyticus]
MPKSTKEQALARFYAALNAKGLELLSEYKGAKEKVTVRCSRGHISQQIPSNIVHTKQSCPFCATHRYHTDKAGIFYCVRWRHPITSHSFLKFGITSKQDHLRRVVQQSHGTEYLPDGEITTRWFIDGSAPPALERVIHDNLKTSYMNKDEFEDGWTETVADTKENISFIKSMVWG